MFDILNFVENDDVQVLDEKGPFTVLEYSRDLSVMPEQAMHAYYCAKMGIRRRQLMCDLSVSPVTIQAGAMQWMVGDVKTTTGIKGVGDLVNKSIRGKLTSESAIKPEYKGTGVLVLEPVWKHIILLDVSDWNHSLVIEDGMFMACDSDLKHTLVMRNNFSSAVAGNEGLFNLGLEGNGVVALESPVPKEELVTIELKDDVLKVDGSFAVAWSGSLKFSVERSGKSLLGSAVSQEGLVNVYRGTGRVLLAPTLDNPNASVTPILSEMSK
jgi:uncharacterized protein (AIM24 family)